MLTNSNALTVYIAAFIDELVRSNVKQIVVSPGSRSTPIAMVAADHPDMKVWINVDERSAAFFALGIAKASRQPVALVCTSGTAVANYMPAIVEAKESQIPLLVLTADRPHELRDIGAPQAIDQIHIFGKQVKWFVEMAVPEDTPDMLRYVRTVAARAVSTACLGPSGPVHLNFPFREPLAAVVENEDTWRVGIESRNQFVKVEHSHKLPEVSQVEDLTQTLQAVKKGLIICGPYDKPGFADDVIALAEKLRFPIIADPLSQLRSGEHSKNILIDSYDAFLRNEYIAEKLVPEVVIRFGAMPVSKALTLFLKKHPQVQQIMIDGDGLWRDPTLLASLVIHAEPSFLCRALEGNLSESTSNETERENWLNTWTAVDHIAGECLRDYGLKEEQFEGNVILQLADCLPSGSTLFVGNSMPIRDIDSFFLANQKKIRLLANRGANGIDGTISSALGASTVEEPLVLVVGDLTFYHDLNGLLAAKLHNLNATIIIINNDGGGIFSFLPQANHPKNFEMLFGTPLGLDYRHVVEMYGGEFKRLEDWGSFKEEVQQSIEAGGLQVIEVQTDREVNVQQHRAIWTKTNEAIINSWEHVDGE